MTDRVSVVLLTCDRPYEFTRAVASVHTQTLSPVEIVIVDTGTVPIDSLIPPGGVSMRVIHAPGCGGNARNLGAEACTGEYLAFLDDDDEWYPLKLETQMSSAKGHDIVCSPYDMELPDGIEVFEPPSCPDKGILGENTVGCTSMPLLRRSSFLDCGGFDSAMRSNQEWDLWVRMLEHGTITVTDAPVGIKHLSKDSISSDTRRRRDGWIRMFGKHLPEYIRNPRQSERALWFMYREMLRHRSYPMAFVGVIAYGCMRIPMIILDLARGIDVNRRSS